MFICHVVGIIIILVLCNLIFEWTDWLGLTGYIVMAIIILLCVDGFITLIALEEEGAVGISCCIFIAMIFVIGALIEVVSVIIK